MAKLSVAKAKPIAERMFVEDGENAKYIAEFLGYSEQTISKWRQGDPKKGLQSWDEKRAQNLSAPHNIKRLLQKELEKVAQGEKSNIDADALAKISRVLQDVSGKISVQVTMSVFKEFDQWMSEEDLEMALLITKWHRKFIIYKASKE